MRTKIHDKNVYLKLSAAFEWVIHHHSIFQEKHSVLQTKHTKRANYRLLSDEKIRRSNEISVEMRNRGKIKHTKIILGYYC